MEAGRYAFISYSSENQRVADSIRRQLFEAGIPRWMAPYDIPAGSKYAYVINDAVKNCGCFVLLLTKESQESPFVERELDCAIEYRRPVVAIHLDDSALNPGFRYYLGNTQIVDVRSEGTMGAIASIAAFVRAPYRPMAGAPTAQQAPQPAYVPNRAATGAPVAPAAQRVPQTAYVPYQTAPGAPPPKNPWYVNSWIVALFLVFFFPVGLVLMWNKKCTWPFAVKLSLTLFFVVYIVFIVVYSFAVQT